MAIGILAIGIPVGLAVEADFKKKQLIDEGCCVSEFVYAIYASHILQIEPAINFNIIPGVVMHFYYIHFVAIYVV